MGDSLRKALHICQLSRAQARRVCLSHFAQKATGRDVIFAGETTSHEQKTLNLLCFARASAYTEEFCGRRGEGPKVIQQYIDNINALLLEAETESMK